MLPDPTARRAPRAYRILMHAFLPFPLSTRFRSRGESRQVGDVVFCAVEPGFRYCTQQIKKIEWVWDDDIYVDDWEPHFTISDLKGRETGWCFHTNIYGKLIFVE